MATVRRGEAVKRFFSFAAPAYDLQFLQHWVYRPAQDEVIARLKADHPQRVADIACGTGLLADQIQRELHVDEVYGVDMSAGMLAQARRRSSAVQWLEGPAEQLPFDEGTLDAVVTTSAFHFFDQPAALREFHRVLSPGGLAAIATISPRPQPPLRLQRLFASRLILPHNPSPSEMRALIERAGFRVDEQHRVHRPAWTRLIPDLITVGTKA